MSLRLFWREFEQIDGVFYGYIRLLHNILIVAPGLFQLKKLNIGSINFKLSLCYQKSKNMENTELLSKKRRRKETQKIVFEKLSGAMEDYKKDHYKRHPKSKIVRNIIFSTLVFFLIIAFIRLVT